MNPSRNFFEIDCTFPLLRTSAEDGTWVVGGVPHCIIADPSFGRLYGRQPLIHSLLM